MTQNNERDALIDFNYFDKKLKSMIRDLQSYTPDELARELQRLSNTASPISQNEQQAVVGVVYDRYLAASEHGMYLNTFYSDKELELESKLYTSPPKQIPDGWKPIETAPKDGSQIDVWVDGEFPCRWTGVYWGMPQHECGEMGSYCDSDIHYAKAGWVHEFNMFITGDVTHWMPLPAAPTNTEVGE